MRLEIAPSAPQLLHPEIEIVPGRKGQHPQTNAHGIGPGSAIVRLVNNSTRENAYIVHLRCEHPFWQEEWFTLKALPGSTSSVEADQYGPGRRRVKVFLPPRATRDILIVFALPELPASRAGLYPFTVVVETFVSNSANTNGHRNGSSHRNGSNGHRTPLDASQSRTVELPATAIVRPFYKWDVDLTPQEGHHVGRVWRRTGKFDVVVTNQGNDWLYCDLQPSRDKDIVLTSPTRRVAVPPPPVNEEEIQRVVPLYGTTRLKLWRGSAVAQNIGLSAVRVDAPSVPPRAFDSTSDTEDFAESENTFGAVLAHETNDVRDPEEERALVYKPPIPSSPFGLGALMQGVVVLMGLFALITVGTLAFETWYRSAIIAEPLTMDVKPGGTLTLVGRYLIGAKVFINGSEEATPQVINKPDIANRNPEARTILDDTLNEHQYIHIPISESYSGQKIKLRVQRAGFLSFLSSLLPSYDCHTLVQVGTPARTVLIEGGGAPGASFAIRLTNGPVFTKPKGNVFLAGKPCEIVAWRPRIITAQVPSNAPPGPTSVIVQTADGAPVSITGQIEVLVPQPPLPEPTSPGSSTEPQEGTEGSSDRTNTSRERSTLRVKPFPPSDLPIILPTATPQHLPLPAGNEVKDRPQAKDAKPTPSKSPQLSVAPTSDSSMRSPRRGREPITTPARTDAANSNAPFHNDGTESIPASSSSTEVKNTPAPVAPLGKLP